MPAPVLKLSDERMLLSAPEVRKSVGGRGGASRQGRRRQVQSVRRPRLGDGVGLDLWTQPVSLHAQVVLEGHPHGLVRRNLQDRGRRRGVERPGLAGCVWACPEANTVGPEANIHADTATATDTRTEAKTRAFTRIALSPKLSDQKDRALALQEPGTSRKMAISRVYTARSDRHDRPELPLPMLGSKD